MRCPPALLGRRAVDDRARERMTELHSAVQLEKPGSLRGGYGTHAEAELIGCPPEQGRVTDGISGRDQQQLLCLTWQESEPAQKAILNSGRKWWSEHSVAAGQSM